MKKIFNFIGGEPAADAGKYDFCFTDSGRSSLRLILKSLPRGSRCLLPDFLCPVIVDVFESLRLKYSFYRVKTDFSIDPKSVADKKFDIFYSINFWGKKNTIPAQARRAEFIIEDNVFLPDFEPVGNFAKWAGFNSFRKISDAADGSLVKANFELKKQFRENGPAPFAALKYKAGQIKYDFLKHGKYSEKKYLSLFKEAESLLDKQKKIYSISDRGMMAVMDFYRNLECEEKQRWKNFSVLESLLKKSCIRGKPDFPSYYPFLAEDRDSLREKLFADKIFLPVHWPRNAKNTNPVCDHIISIPLHGKYSERDMERVAKCILEFYLKI